MDLEHNLFKVSNNVEHVCAAKQHVEDCTH